MKPLINKLIKQYLRRRINKVRLVAAQPAKYQKALFMYLLKQGRGTVFGRENDFDKIRTLKEFQHRIPLQNYNKLKPYIYRMMLGEQSVLWPGKVKYFAKSSGTSEDQSKFLPISRENLFQCHIGSSWDALAAFYDNIPNSRLFSGKSILIGGSYEHFEAHPETIIGDISSLMMLSMPPIGKPFAALDKATFFLKDWEEKINAIAEIGIKTPEIVMMCGVPTWSIAIFNKILEKSGKKHMLELWPGFQGFIHGGVNFLPYRKTFRKLFPSEHVRFQEAYNSTEGYFAMQDDFSDSGMMLLLNNGMFFEFVETEQLGSANPVVVPVWEVKKGVDYAILVSTNSGLWRFVIGDTVQFVSLQPYRIRITGRTKLFINAFGEEVIIENTDTAVAMTCERCNAEVSDYTVAPHYINLRERGFHEWFIEFAVPPDNINQFALQLDNCLRTLNSDYDIKRSKDLALDNLQIHVLPKGTFERWLAAKGKLGGQNKVPRLSNDRKIAEDLLNLLSLKQLK